MSASVKPSRATGRVTLAHVAERAGVSPITVSRALRGVATVDPALAERVQAAVSELGYVPDSAARALASRTSAHVTVMVPLLTNALFIDLLDAAQSVFRQAGFEALIGVTHYDSTEEERLLREQLAHRPAGLLITGSQHSAATRRLLAASGVPSVRMMELAGDQDCVGFSQRAAAAAMTRHLLERGRRRIAFVAVQLDPRTLQRREGWRDALRRAGGWDAALSFEDARASSMALGAELLQRVLREQPDVDAIFFCNDDLAQGALLAALRSGIDVPGRVAVAGFNDLPGSDQMLPPLTTVRTPRREIGEQAARLLLARIAGEVTAPRRVDLGFELLLRAST